MTGLSNGGFVVTWQGNDKDGGLYGIYGQLYDASGNVLGGGDYSQFQSNVPITKVIGGNGDDSINGNAANNILSGGLGTDTLIGGQGNDTYVLDDVGDKVIEKANEGFDTAIANASYTLASNVEKLMLTGTTNINGTGNSAANRIEGNSGNNILDGKSGIDSLVGGLGNDTYI